MELPLLKKQARSAGGQTGQEKGWNVLILCQACLGTLYPFPWHSSLSPYIRKLLDTQAQYWHLYASQSCVAHNIADDFFNLCFSF